MGPNIIFTLKVAVIAVTVLLLCSLVALARGQYRTHGRINLAFFILTLGAVLGLEVIIRFVDPEAFEYIRSKPELYRHLQIHLCFAVPSLMLMPAMLYTGLTRKRSVHVVLAVLFSIAWLGTFITGVFFL